MEKKNLVDGFNRFRHKYYESGEKLMQKLAKEGATPWFFIINCIDPRNGADLVFDAQPGQQFIHSQMAAIIPPYDKHKQPELNASLSYAADTKKIKHLIIAGHTQCGGVNALVNGTPDKYIEEWVQMAAEAKAAAQKKLGDKADPVALQAETERQVVIMSYKNIIEYPMVKNAVARGDVAVVAWLFDLEKGALFEYRPDKNDFVQLSTPLPASIAHKHAAHKPPKAA